jgi:hypothetical protein
MPDPPVLADFVRQQFATRDLEGDRSWSPPA